MGPNNIMIVEETIEQKRDKIGGFICMIICTFGLYLPYFVCEYIYKNWRVPEFCKCFVKWIPRTLFTCGVWPWLTVIFKFHNKLYGSLRPVRKYVFLEVIEQAFYRLLYVIITFGIACPFLVLEFLSSTAKNLQRLPKGRNKQFGIYQISIATGGLAVFYFGNQSMNKTIRYFSKFMSMCVSTAISFVVAYFCWTHTNIALTYKYLICVCVCLLNYPVYRIYINLKYGIMFVKYRKIYVDLILRSFIRVKHSFDFLTTQVKNWSSIKKSSFKTWFSFAKANIKNQSNRMIHDAKTWKNTTIASIRNTVPQIITPPIVHLGTVYSPTTYICKTWLEKSNLTDSQLFDLAKKKIKYIVSNK